MAKVTITYKAWDHNEVIVPADQNPEVWFRPLRTSLANGMMTDREVKGTLSPTTGVGQVELPSEPGLLFVPVMRWTVPFTNPMKNVGRRYCEWEPIFPGNGGPIDELPDVVQMRGFYYGFGDPPTYLRVRNDVIYIDISGAVDGYWQPWVPEGTHVEGGA